MNEASKAYSYRVKVGHVAANPITVKFDADATERKEIANVWDVPAVESFTGEAAVSRWKRDGVRVKGHVKVRIVQDCVVTLEPVEQTISEDFEALFVPENSRLARREPSDGELFVDPDGADIPDTFSGDSIDLGAVAAEFAALAIDPYPRKEGAEFEEFIESDPAEDKKESPFAVLKFRHKGDKEE
ncbi:MAG: metal-binding protein [Rhizobiales bacterium]|nr:metal-binding protein [Hyphomicrobiales bacterium]|tara:strand:+ start:678 stop:1235 length:558 start_codon:yes stop_codon:yes gene_type:complete